jgi:hypothetical protein
MFDAEDVNEPLVVTDLVVDAIGATSGRPETSEFTLERVTDLARIVAERPEHELDHRRGDPLGEAGKLSFG